MRRPKLYPAWIVFALVLILDQASKILTRHYTRLHESYPILQSWFGDTFRYTHLENTGASFSISVSQNPIWNRLFFITVSLLAVVFITYLLYKAIHRIQVWGFGLLLGGALGNLIDRVFRGAVTDFIDIDIPNMFGMDRFPVFNIADSAIFIGMVLLIIDMVFIRDESGSAPAPVIDENSIEQQGVIDE